MIIYLLSWWLRNCFSKKNKCISIIWGLKNHLLTLDDYLLSCGDGGGRVGGGGQGGSGGIGGGTSSYSECSGGGRVDGGSSGSDGSGNSSDCEWLWLLFIVVNILFYCNRYIILLWCLYYFILLKIKINPLLQRVQKVKNVKVVGLWLFDFEFVSSSFAFWVLLIYIYILKKKTIGQ